MISSKLIILLFVDGKCAVHIVTLRQKTKLNLLRYSDCWSKLSCIVSFSCLTLNLIVALSPMDLLPLMRRSPLIRDLFIYPELF